MLCPPGRARPAGRPERFADAPCLAPCRLVESSRTGKVAVSLIRLGLQQQRLLGAVERVLEFVAAAEGEGGSVEGD